jgi:hypothetical protein
VICRPKDRVQRGHRLLKDHADVAAAHLADCLLRQPQQIAAAKYDLALGDPPGRVRDQAEDRQGASGFARPALADDCDRLAAIDRVRDAVNGRHDPGTGAKFGVQIPDV